MASPRVLLLGGHGKVAHHLTPLLLNRGWDVTSVVRNPEHQAQILRFNDHEGATTGGDRGGRGTVTPLVSSLDEVKSVVDAERVIETTRPDYVVWAAGAGGKGGPARTYAVDQDAAKHYIRAALPDLNISKFLLISHLGSRRNRAPWWTDTDWQAAQGINAALPDYYRAKLEADEFFVALAMKRKDEEAAMTTAAAAGAGAGAGAEFQGIVLRPGRLSDEPATREVQLGQTQAHGTVSREDVAIVADMLLARSDTHGMMDLLGGDVPVDEAVDNVARRDVSSSALDGEDVDAIRDRFADESMALEFRP